MKSIPKKVDQALSITKDVIAYKGWLGYETPVYRLASLPSRNTAQGAGDAPTANPAQATVRLPE